MDFLLIPPVACILSILLGGVLSGLGRLLAGPENPTAAKRMTYAGGEESPQRMAAPGYRPFFVIALFFAILHLGVLMLGSSTANWTSALYLGGLILALWALILG
jgi:NADH:ubiquinone oxidoreductase subunit 3 (subunit A)